MHPIPQEVLSARTTHADAVIQEMTAKFLRPALTVPFTVAAVGGYGRSELFPHSDVDVLILVEQETDLTLLKEPLSLFLRELWDSGLRASQSVRTVAECLQLHEQNIELHISLLDLRFICGSREPFDLLTRSLPEFFRKYEVRITRDLAEMARKRHAKFNDTVYHLEPNIKEAPGGIRDIHFLHWLALLAQEKGAIRDALREVDDSRQFLYAVRCFLHQRTHRDNNLLGFELQDRIAENWGPEPIEPGDWMRLYYRHARRVFHSALKALEFAEMRASPLVQQFRDWRSRLSTSDFTVSHERVLLRNPASTMSSAASILELFTFMARHGLHLSWDAHRRLTANSESTANLLRTEKIPWSGWREFFSQPYVALALRQMQETAILAAAIPNWKCVECLVVRDFYHRYTVDEHSIVAVEVVDRLAAEKVDKSDLPIRMRNLLKEDDQVPILRLALLLHDVGKGTLPGNHVKGSIDVCAEVFDRLSVPLPGQQIICFLIEHHLDLSMVMTGRDLDDPATARFLTSRIGTQEDLRRLTLLTFADISAVNPTAMTPWRMEQLWRVYLSASEQLTRELIADRIDGEATAALGTDLASDLTNFLRGFPTRYLRTHTQAQIQHHFEMEKKRTPGGAVVEITQDSGAYLLTCVADDRPGHFASVCGALSSCGMNILKAEAASNENGCILDMIRFADPMRTLELNPDEVGTLERTIRSAAEGTVRVSELLKRRRAAPRPSSGAKISPSFRFNNEASDQCTLIDFVGEDRPGLLYDLTSVISAAGCNIELLLVDTEAHKAMDVFYVTQHAGKLDSGTQASLARALLEAASVN